MTLYKSQALILALALSFLPFAASAEAPENRFLLRAHGALVSPASDLVNSGVSIEGESTSFSLDDGEGFGLGFEFRVSSRIGVDVVALFADVDGLLVLDSPIGSSRATDSVGVEAYSIGFNYYLNPGSRAETYVGVRAGFLYNEDATFRFSDRTEILRFDDDNLWEAHVGLLFRFSSDSPWVLSAEAAYGQTIFEGEIAGQDVDFDPFILTLGVGYRF